MNRVLNVIVITGLAATLACAPQSRKQATKKDGAPQNGQQSNQGGPNPSPTPSSNDVTAVDVVKNTGTPVSPSAIKKIAIEGATNGELGIKLESGVAGSQVLQVTVKADGSISGNDSRLTDLKYNCSDASVKPSQCPEADITFNLDKEAVSAVETYVANAQVDKYILNPSGKGFAPSPLDTVKNFGSASVRKIALSIGANNLNASKVLIVANGADTSGAPDDIQAASGAVIKVFGLPKTDKDGKKLSYPSINKSSARNEELVSVYSTTSENIRYSVLVVGSSANTQTLVLQVKPGTQAAKAEESAEQTQSASSPAPDAGVPPAPSTSGAAAAKEVADAINKKPIALMKVAAPKPEMPTVSIPVDAPAAPAVVSAAPAAKAPAAAPKVAAQAKPAPESGFVAGYYSLVDKVSRWFDK